MIGQGREEEGCSESSWDPNRPSLQTRCSIANAPAGLLPHRDRAGPPKRVQPQLGEPAREAHVLAPVAVPVENGPVQAVHRAPKAVHVAACRGWVEGALYWNVGVSTRSATLTNTPLPPHLGSYRAACHS